MRDLRREARFKKNKVGSRFMENLFDENFPHKKLVSPREFAQLLGVSRKTVNEAIISKRLDHSITTEASGYHRIDVIKAVFEWFENADPTKDHENKLVEVRRLSGETIPSFSESKRQKEHYIAQTLRLEYEEKLGNLVPRGSLEKELYEIGRTFRDRLLVLPDTLSQRLIGLELIEIRKLMSSELEQVLIDLTGGLHAS